MHPFKIPLYIEIVKICKLLGFTNIYFKQEALEEIPAEQIGGLLFDYNLPYQRYGLYIIWDDIGMCLWIKDLNKMVDYPIPGNDMLMLTHLEEYLKAWVDSKRSKSPIQEAFDATTLGLCR